LTWGRQRAFEAAWDAGAQPGSRADSGHTVGRTVGDAVSTGGHGDGQAERARRDFEELVDAASHALQAPLWHAAGFTDLLVRHLDQLDCTLDERAIELRGLLIEAVGEMRAVVDGLLAFARVTTQGGPMTDVVALDELARRALADAGTWVAEANAVVDIPPDLPVVTGDRAQLQAALAELLTNACKFGGRDGATLVEVRAATDGDAVVVEVRDHGAGIAPNARERVWRPFKREHGDDVPGVGIGLAVVRRIVERHGGGVEVADAGPGAVVRLRLPARQEPAAG
jgi:signal transduction histidine kinase